MYAQPWYSGYNYPGYAPNFVHYPYQSGYNRASLFQPRGYDREDNDIQERTRALAERRARRAQYLPDEEDDDIDDWGYGQMGLRQRAYLEAMRQRKSEELRLQEEAAKERARQQQLLEKGRAEQEMFKKRALERQERQWALERKQREEEEERLKLVMERKRQARMRREEEARRTVEQEMTRQQRGRSQSPSHTTDLRQASPSTDQNYIPVHFQNAFANGFCRPDTSAPNLQSPRSPTPTSKPKHTAEEMNEAAARIQNQYRIHRSSKTLDQLAAEFQTLKNNFVYPRVIDFQKPGGEFGHITVGAYRPPSEFNGKDDGPMMVDGPEAKLDFTSTNHPLHTYADALDKLLIKLDSVESWGKKQIRDKRRSTVKDIEKEVSKLEGYWKQTWMDYLARQATESKIRFAASEPVPSELKMNVTEEPQSQQETPVRLPVQEEGPRKIPISSSPRTDSKDVSMDNVVA